MTQVVILKFGSGSWREGFPTVIAQLQELEGSVPMQLTGSLPPALELQDLFLRWQSLYAALSSRFNRRQIEVDQDIVTNVSEKALQDLNDQIKSQLNRWLGSNSFGRIERQMRVRLLPSAELRVILETKDTHLRQFPWDLWNFFEDYPQSEVALSPPNYGIVSTPRKNISGRVRILAILGSSDGINIEKDRLLLKQLPDAETVFLVEPQREALNYQLWDEKGWDILFFAGHSTSNTDDSTGVIDINRTESLTIDQLKNALKTAIKRGLRLAIFNSCDGLGLANQLADLNIPQIIVMREPVPDLVAQEFIKHCLTQFSRGQSLYQSVREARERLQGLETQFPCASWLPVICQNPAGTPPTWQTLRGKSDREVPPKPRQRFRTALLTSVVMAIAVMGIRHLGALQPFELKAFDQLMRLRPDEGPDRRLLVVAITDADLQLPEQRERSGSLSDLALSQLLQKLESYQPRAIGLDIFRPYPVDSKQPELSAHIRNNKNFFAICKIDSNSGFSPPPDLSLERQGFANSVPDSDNVTRRHLVLRDAPATSPCSTKYSLSLKLALHYLEKSGTQLQILENWNLQLGKVLLHRLHLKPGAFRNDDTWGMQIILNYRSYRSPTKIADIVTLEQVLRNKVNPDLVKDRIVLIGAIHSSSDYFFTPYSTNQSSDQRMPGVVLQAQMVSQLISAVQDERPLINFLPFWLDLLWVGGWSLVGAGLALCIQSRRTLGFANGIMLGGSIGICYYLLVEGIWIAMVPSAIAVVGSSLLVHWMFSYKNTN